MLVVSSSLILSLENLSTNFPYTNESIQFESTKFWNPKNFVLSPLLLTNNLDQKYTISKLIMLVSSCLPSHAVGRVDVKHKMT